MAIAVLMTMAPVLLKVSLYIILYSYLVLAIPKHLFALASLALKLLSFYSNGVMYVIWLGLSSISK